MFSLARSSDHFQKASLPFFSEDDGPSPKKFKNKTKIRVLYDAEDLAHAYTQGESWPRKQLQHNQCKQSHSITRGKIKNESGHIPKFRVRLKLQHWRVCVPLQGPSEVISSTAQGEEEEHTELTAMTGCRERNKSLRRLPYAVKAQNTAPKVQQGNTGNITEYLLSDKSR